MSVWPDSIDLIKALPAKAVESQRLVFCHLFKMYYIGDEVVRNKQQVGWNNKQPTCV